MSSIKIIQDILKVNHAGECGAVQIYKGQCFVALLLSSNHAEFFSRALQDEQKHRDIFRDAMRQRSTRPCKALWFWSLGGFFIGFTTASLGRNISMICTWAVEETVHKHLHEQILFLNDHDADLREKIESIYSEEVEHLDYGKSHGNLDTGFSKLIYHLIRIATETVIFLSTWGASGRLNANIKHEIRPD